MSPVWLHLIIWPTLLVVLIAVEEYKAWRDRR